MDGSHTLVLAFAGPAVVQEGTPQQAALEQLGRAFPLSQMAGCSTAGEILADRVRDDSISVVVARFEHTRLCRASTSLAGPGDSLAAGGRLAAALPHEGLRSVLVLSDGLNVNGSPLVEGLHRALPAGVVVTGGLAGDGDRFASTWVLDGVTPRRQHVVTIGLYGDRLRVGHGCDGGWHDFGPERRITRAEGNVLYELDGKPALDLYKHYLGDRAAGLPGAALLFPLAVRRDGGGPSLVRTVLATDEQARSMTFAGDIPQGGIARLMRSTTERLIDSAARAAATAFGDGAASGDSLAITVSCVGRRLVLGERTEEEVEAVLDRAPPRCGHVGFYSYGEISPTQPGGASELHNQTMTVTVLAET
ncbi:MAG: FIST C-terminal domain-containing protein [Rubrivivax sp.]|nr:FIST C-terminal domain-containing protein [Rubrivivax sp.]